MMFHQFHIDMQCMGCIIIDLTVLYDSLHNLQCKRLNSLFIFDKNVAYFVSKCLEYFQVWL